MQLSNEGIFPELPYKFTENLNADRQAAWLGSLGVYPRNQAHIVVMATS
jgi:hypothetical protein